MSFDYSGLELTAQTLVTRFGKPLILARASRVPDPTKPWLTEQGDTAASAAQSIDVIGVVLGPAKGDVATTNVENRSGRVLISTATPLPEELAPDWTVEDSTRKYEITNAIIVEPGPTLLLYKLDVAL